MKFELIAALLHNPRLLLLDEPTIGLDIASQRAIHSFLHTVNQEYRTTIMLTSHYARDIEALADRLVILQHGHIQYDGSLTKLLSLYQQPTKILRIETEYDLTTYRLGFEQVAENTWECELEATRLNEVLEELAHEIPMQSISSQEKSLEDILYSLYTPDSSLKKEPEHASL